MSDDSASEIDVANEGDSKRKKQKLSPEQVMNKSYQKSIMGNSWIKHDLNRFLSKCEVYCMLCSTYIKIGSAKYDKNGDIICYENNSGAIGKHCKTEMHTKKFRQYENKNRCGSITSYVKILKPDVDRKAYDDEVNMVNSLTSCGLVAEGLNSNLIERIFNQSLLFDSIKFLNANNKSFCTDYAIKTNLVTGCDYLDNEIKKMLHNEPMAIITDSASLKSDSAVAVLASCAKLPKPILLQLIVPEEKSSNEENDVYDAELFAGDIRKVLDKFGIDLSKQVTCLMGDNVSYNRATAN
jgi:hypothetical protein